MKIYLASDHAGFELKEKIKIFLRQLGHEVFDEGAFAVNPDDDYPDFIKLAAKEVQSNPGQYRGIIFGGSGVGEAIVANRFSGVRAVVYDGNQQAVVLSRQHNDSNILSLGARLLSEAEAEEIIKLWLTTDFSGDDRHRRRIDKIDQELANEISL